MVGKEKVKIELQLGKYGEVVFKVYALNGFASSKCLYDALSISGITLEGAHDIVSKVKSQLTKEVNLYIKPELLRVYETSTDTTTDQRSGSGSTNDESADEVCNKKLSGKSRKTVNRSNKVKETAVS